ncbi:MAG: queuosine precursor transporter [Candidatus Babeliales bacterium]
MNELIFIINTCLIGLTALGCLRMGSHALTTFIATQCILANLFVIQQISLLHYNATCADPFTIGSVLSLNLLQEYYGRHKARHAIWISFFMLIFYACSCLIVLAYLPHAFDTAHPHFFTLLNHMPRITLASLFAYITVQHTESFLYALLNHLFRGRYLVLRNCISISVCQLIDTILFSFLGLYGIVHSLHEIITTSYFIKIGALLLSIPFIAFSRRIKHGHS